MLLSVREAQVWNCSRKAVWDPLEHGSVEEELYPGKCVSGSGSQGDTRRSNLTPDVVLK